MNIKILIGDIETIKGFSLFGFYDPQEDKWYEFRINKYINQLFEFAKFCEDYKEYYQVYFNGLKFDSQVIEYVLRNYQKWGELSNLDVCLKIWKFSQVVIDLTNNEEFPPYSESQCRIRQIDAFEIPHFSNKARRCSLKWLEFMMDAPNIEEMPYPHDKIDFTEEEIEEMVLYWKNDIIELHRWYKYLTGDAISDNYKGRNKVQDRLDLIETMGLDERFMSFSDVKIGDELNKLGYCKLANKTAKDLYELKKNRGGTRRFTFGEAIPSYVSFKTEQLKAFYNKIKDIKVSLSDGEDQEFPLDFMGTKYTIARGGIHSTESNRIIKPTTHEILIDADIGSQYPNAIVKRRLFPSHLGEEWLVNYKSMIDIRIALKANSKDNPKNKGLSEMYKLALNGGGFGKTNERSSWQYDPKVTYYCTIGNQFEILMLIEMLELAGIHIVSANTDGILCLFDRAKMDVYYEICHKWEELVGNKEQGILEYTEFKMIAQESVNCYVALKTDDSEKIKGRFAWDVELHKNNTDKIGRIERKAIVKFLTKGIPVEETIKGGDNIFDFCIGVKSSRNYRFATVDKNGEVENHKKIIRFFASKDGKRLFKIKNEECDTNGADVMRIADTNLVSIFNRSYKLPIAEYNINYDFYIQKAEEIVRKVVADRKNSKYKEPPKEQISLF